jgi:hypothetical protein
MGEGQARRFRAVVGPQPPFLAARHNRPPKVAYRIAKDLPPALSADCPTTIADCDFGGQTTRVILAAISTPNVNALTFSVPTTCDT